MLAPFARPGRLVLLLALCLWSGHALAASGWPPPQERIELTGFAGYQVNSTVYTAGGTIDVGDAPSYGFIVDVPVRPSAFVELLWVYSTTQATFTATNPAYASSQPFQLATHYFQLGGTQGFRNGPVEGFIALTVGASLFVPGEVTLVTGSSVQLNDTWEFAFTAGGGFKVFLLPSLALRFEARLEAPVYFTGGAFYAGSGGAGLVVSGGIPFVQGDFTAGLVFAP